MEPVSSLPHSPRARHVSLSWTRAIQSMSPHSTCWRSIPILFYFHTLGLLSWFLPSVLPTKTLLAVYGGVWQHCTPCTWYTVRATQNTRTDLCGKLGGGTVTYRLLFKNYEALRRVMLQTVPFILLWAQTPSATSCSDTPSICVFPYSERPRNRRRSYNFACSKFSVSRQRTG